MLDVPSPMDGFSITAASSTILKFELERKKDRGREQWGTQIPSEIYSAVTSTDLFEWADYFCAAFNNKRKQGQSRLTHSHTPITQLDFIHDNSSKNKNPHIIFTTQQQWRSQSLKNRLHQNEATFQVSGQSWRNIRCPYCKTSCCNTKVSNIHTLSLSLLLCTIGESLVIGVSRVLEDLLDKVMTWIHMLTRQLDNRC